MKFLSIRCKDDKKVPNLPQQDSITMAKAKTIQSTPPIKSQSVPFQVQWPAFFKQKNAIGIGIFCIAALLYAQSLFHGFVMDDAIVITDNMFTQKGASGLGGILTKDTFFGFFKEAGKETVVDGGRYRPFSLVVFALMHSVFGNSPLYFHLLTVLLYAFTCLTLYKTVKLCLERPSHEPQVKHTVIASIAAFLFAVHPVHVEVVANIKGCDEILSLLGSLGALYFTLKAYDRKSLPLALLAAVIFLTGLFSKENAFMFIVLLPAALVLFRDSDGSKAESITDGLDDNAPRIGVFGALKSTAPCLIAGLFFFVVRYIILDGGFGSKETPDFMNNPFLKIKNNLWVPMDFGERFGTIFQTLTLYLKMLIVPHPLTHDYYPKHIQMVGLGHPLSLLAVLLYGGLIYVMHTSWRKGQVGVTFGVLTFLVTLFIVSNLMFPVGTNMGERFLFMPSFGFFLAVAVFLTNWAAKKNQVNMMLGLVLVFGIGYSVKTITRVPAWKSNTSLFLTDINTSKQSAKLLNAVGGTYYDEAILLKDPKQEQEQRATLTKAIPYLSDAIKIHPTYKSAFLLRANCFFYLKQYEDSFKDYREAIRIDPNFKDAKTNLAICLREAGKAAGEKEGNVPKAIKYLEESHQNNPKDPETHRLLGIANGIGGQHKMALEWLQKALVLEPQSARILFDLGTAYQFNGDAAKAIEYQQRAVMIDPKVIQR
jgi:protein O-mannosyl-transferase